jgi:uncharacterized protein
VSAALVASAGRARRPVGALAALAVAALAALAAFAALAADVPYLTGRVVDNAEILSPATRERLAATLAAHEQATTNQVVVLTVESLDGESVEGFATRVFEEWKLGQKGKDNGVLVIVAPDDRRMRIEVGYGLEGTLTDAIAARIIRDRMTGFFKAGRYDDGVAAGVEAIVATLEGRESGATAPAAAGEKKRGFLDAEGLDEFESDLPPWPMRILLGAFIFGVIGLFTVIGVLTPGMGWFLYVFLIPFWAMFPIIVLGVRGALVLLAIYVVGFPIAKLIVSRKEWYRKASAELKKTGSATVGGVVITSGGARSGGSWSSGSSRSSGGFSGGGGSSGGGGASGSW